MVQIKSKSEKRIIIEAVINGKAANFLIDTGASVALIDDTQVKKYSIDVGKKYNGSLVGAGGEMRNVRYCNSYIEVGGKKISQFLIADIETVVRSIKKETDIEILGIISLPQMKFAGINIDANDNVITVE